MGGVHGGLDQVEGAVPDAGEEHGSLAGPAFRTGEDDLKVGVACRVLEEGFGLGVEL